MVKDSKGGGSSAVHKDLGSFSRNRSATCCNWCSFRGQCVKPIPQWEQKQASSLKDATN